MLTPPKVDSHSTADLEGPRCDLPTGWPRWAPRAPSRPPRGPARWRRRPRSSTSRSASPTSTPPPRPRGGQARARRRRDALRAVRRHPGAARGGRRRLRRPARRRRRTPPSVFVTVGGKGVMDYAILALVEPGRRGDRPGPRLPDLRSVTRFMGGTPVPIPLRQENDFRLDPDELARWSRRARKLLVLNSPANPTGGVLTREDLERLAELAVRARPAVLPTRSTRGSSTTARSTSRSPRCPAWPSGRSSSTASPRRTR